MSEVRIVEVNGVKIRVTEIDESDYFCISDFTKKFSEHGEDLIKGWLRNKNTIEFMGVWEQLNNVDFKLGEFAQLRDEAGTNRFNIRPQKWITSTNAIGIKSKSGKNGGTYAHVDIALEFASWLSPEFKLYIIKEFQRLKKEEAERNHELAEWSSHRLFAKYNYKIQTDAIKQNIIMSTTLKSEAGYLYSTEADLLNIAVFNMKASEFSKKYPEMINQNKNIRDVASTKALHIIANLESANAKMIREGILREKRFEHLIIQASEEKKSLNLMREQDLFKYDLSVQILLPKANNKPIEAPTEFVSAIDKIIKKK